MKKVFLVALSLASAEITELGVPSFGECSAEDQSCDESALLQGFLQSRQVDSASPVPPEECGQDHVAIYSYIQPELWGTAYNGWEMCAGNQQSPINIVTKLTRTPATLSGRLDTNYGSASDLSVINTGHNLEVKGNFGNVVIDGETYASAQFHLHSPSENAVNGKRSPMVMHIVNNPLDKEPKKQSHSFGGVVVSVDFTIGKPNKCLKQVLKNPPRAGCKRAIDDIDLGKCFEKELAGSWWSFDGSLTTPPCTEGIGWNQMRVRSTISLGQLLAFKTRFKMNARNVQPLNKRVVTFNEVSR